MGGYTAPVFDVDVLADEKEMDYLNSLAQGDDGTPDTPFGSHSSMLRTMMATPPPPPRYSSSAGEALAAQAPMPIPGKPKLWQRIAAGAIGGAAGLVNAGGRTHVDPSGAINAIYEGNTPYEQAKWSQERQRLNEAAQLERQRNLQLHTGYADEIAQHNATSRSIQADSVAKLNDARAAQVAAPKWGATTGGMKAGWGGGPPCGRWLLARRWMIAPAATSAASAAGIAI